MIKELNPAPAYLVPEAVEVDIFASSVMCTSPDSSIASIDEQAQLGSWE